ncbi:hypothetical protein BKA60DRAFT_121412 [Fusarium oxysporum]|nr:hypothetical protein BKA60DRAFT_121412 [Fusarium oxysporum]
MARLPRLPACQSCAQKKTKCDNNRPKCSLCTRNGLECLVSCTDSNTGGQLSRAWVSHHASSCLF